MRPALFKSLAILTVIIFSVTNTFAQEFKLNGVLFESGSKIRIALAEVGNSRNRYVVGSNDMGLFEIRCSIGDTLTISKRGFEDKMVVVASTKDIIVNLNRGTTLNTVTITGQSKKQTLDEIRQEFRNKGSFYAGKPKPLAFIFTPLTALYELFGRTPRNARRFSKMYETEMKQGQVDQLFNKVTINRYTGLEGKELENFMVTYRPEYNQAKNWTVYDSTKWIRDSYKSYTDTVKKN